MYRIICLVVALGWATSQVTSQDHSLIDRNADDFCMRKDGNSGYCKHARTCPIINSMLERKSQGIPFTPAETLYIKDSSCTVHKRGFVCCEDEDKVAEGMQSLNADECGSFNTIIKTIGGKEIELMSRPWMVLLYFSKAGVHEFTCGGTLINKRYVLTAAHCFNEQTLISVRLGEHRISEKNDCTIRKGRRICAPAVEDVGFERIFVHEQYENVSSHNDIALVKLSKDVAFKEHIKPICLPVNKDLQQRWEEIEHFHVTGWGRTENVILSDVPMESIVTFKDHGFCQSHFLRRIVSSQVCAGDLGKDSCNGDSGGPLTYVTLINGAQRFMQTGIVSFGSHNCGDGSPGVYTKIDNYVRWIAYKIATK